MELRIYPTHSPLENCPLELSPSLALEKTVWLYDSPGPLIFNEGLGTSDRSLANLYLQKVCQGERCYRDLYS